MSEHRQAATLSSIHGAGTEAPYDSKPKRDLKKLALIIGLSALAWMSTYSGMLELIQANLGEVGMVEKIGVGLAVAMLQIMIVWLLDQLFSPIHVTVKSFYIVGYLFLTLISVGFAFGFYWKVLESRSESTRSAESSVGQVHGALNTAQINLEQLVATLTTLTAVSTQKAEQEAANGNSCPGSRPGAGPRMAMRKGDAERFQFASDFVGGRVTQVKTDVAAIEGDLAKIIKADASIIDAKTGTRNDFLKGMGRRLDETVTRLNAFRGDPQLKQMRMDFAERAEKTTFADTKGGQFQCADPQLQMALRGVVRAIDGLPNIERPKIAATEGSEAVIEAFRRLTTTLFGALQFKLPPSPEELRAQQQKAMQSVENAAAQQKLVNMDAAGLGKRDYIPLGIAIFVDFCLLMVSFGRPVNAFQQMHQKTKEAQTGPVFEILSRFHDIHNDAIQKNFEVFRHVIFDHGGKYYVAVPLAAPKTVTNEKERRQLELEAQSLANLFSGLEGQQVITRNRALFAEMAVKRKLRRQQSKFAEAGAFRVYRFKNGAWPEMILGAIMGAARMHKEELASKRGEEAKIEAQERVAMLEAKTKLTTERRKLEADLEMDELRHKFAQRREAMLPKADAIQATADTGAKRSGPSQLLRSHGQHPAGGHGSANLGSANLGSESRGGADHGAADQARYTPPLRPDLRTRWDQPGQIFQRPVGLSNSPPPNLHQAPYQRGQDHRAQAGYATSGQPTYPRPHLNGGQPMNAAQHGAQQPIYPANHNTAPADRQRPIANATEARTDMEAQDNVIPLMPERTAALELRGAASPMPQAPALPAHALQTPRRTVATDIGDLLKGVAVTQMKVAHDIAAAVHEIEKSGRSRIAAPGAAMIEAEPVTKTVEITAIEDALAVREQASWKNIGIDFDAEVGRALGSTRQATGIEPRRVDLSDIGDSVDRETSSVASRFAPVQRNT